MKAGILVTGLVLAAALLGWTVLGASTDRGILITGIVAKPVGDGKTVSVFTITNSGAPDRLLSVSSPAGPARLYSPADAQGVPVPTGAASLALDAAHVELDTGDQIDGDLIPLSLTFARAGTLKVKARLSDPATAGAASEVGLFGLGDICVVEDGEPAPEIALKIAADGDGWLLQIDTHDFTFSDAHTGLFHVPGMGHGHLYVGGAKLGRIFAPEARIGALPPGRHEVRVTLNTNDHRAYVVDGTPASATAIIQVD